METTAQPTTNTPVKPEGIKIDKGSYILEQNILGGAMKGLSYFVPVFKNENVEQAKESLSTALNKWTKKDGDPENGYIILVALINSALRTRIRAEAVSEVPALDSKIATEKRNADRAASNPILLDSEKADNYIPGTRELTVGGMMTKAAKLQKEGKAVEALQLLQEAMQLLEAQAKEEQNEEGEGEATETVVQ